MNPLRTTAADYIDFLIGSPAVVSATEAARVQPDRPEAPAHDSFTRLLLRLEPDPDTLAREIGSAVAWRRPNALQLVLDASLAVLRRPGPVADKPFCDSLLNGLFYLQGETAYRVRADPTAAIPYDDVPGIRACCAKLAKRLADVGHGGHPVVVHWLEQAAADPLPRSGASSTNV